MFVNYRNNIIELLTNSSMCIVRFIDYPMLLRR